MQDDEFPKTSLVSISAVEPEPAAKPALPPNPGAAAEASPKPQVSVRPLALSELEEAFALTRAHPELKIIASDDVVRRVLKQNAYTFWGVYPAESGAPLLGYYGFLLLNANGETALIEGTLDPLAPDPSLLAGTEERPDAIYIWLMVVPGLSSRATPMVTAALGKICKGAPLYARAGTQAGLNLMRRQGFRPVDPDREGIGALCIFGAIDTLKVRETRVKPLAPRFEIKVAGSGADVEAAFAIRSAVYLTEQNCPYEEEFDGNDRSGTHLIGTVGGEPAATLRLRYFAEFVKIERVAVLPRHRNTLIGKELMKFALEFIRRKGYRTVYGHVQKRLVNYWRRYGFVPLETAPLVFSDHEYVVMKGELDPHPKALNLHSDPYVLLRPEGNWDEPCALERSAARPATNPH